MLESGNTLTRPIEGHPYGCTAFVCNDILGIADVEEAFASCMNVISIGKPLAQGHTRLQNRQLGGNGYTNNWLSERPIVGNVDGLPHYPRRWSNPAVFPLVPQLDKYCIVATARLQGLGEFITNGNLALYGNQLVGGLASYWDINLTGYNLGGAASSQLINRFYQNRAQHVALTSPLGLTQAATAVDVDWGAINPVEGGFKTVVVTGTVDPSLFVNLTTINVATLSFGLDYPVAPLGNGWSNIEKDPVTGGTSMHILPSNHPLSGIPLYCDGVVDFQVYFYR